AVPEGRYETLAGFLTERLQRLPEEGDVVRVDDVELTVETVQGRRVARVVARRMADPPGTEPDDRARSSREEVAA
ncbi:transporter associated domain-containing protein, partial [Blastococcus sp. TF02A_35]|uniref:transporter associated domain-containing protein n=1 Tax=Blastococcus sp. TF02A-35 TaxID=2559612 RepID=UPI001102AF9D